MAPSDDDRVGLTFYVPESERREARVRYAEADITSEARGHLAAMRHALTNRRDVSALRLKEIAKSLPEIPEPAESRINILCRPKDREMVDLLARRIGGTRACPRGSVTRDVTLRVALRVAARLTPERLRALADLIPDGRRKAAVT